MKEKFVRINQIQGYENVRDCYWISNSDEDKIMNRDTGKMMKIWINTHGYPVVSLRTKSNKIRKCRIHVMKAKAFIYSPNPLSYNVVRHLNDVKTDNRLTNLAWGTVSNNIRDSIRNGRFSYKNTIKASAKGRAVIAKKYSIPVKCIETGMIYPSACEAERQTGINNGNINSCCRGKRKTAKGLHWEYINKDK